MEISIESTSKVVTFEVDGAHVPARIWEGHTKDGTPVHCYITRICPSMPQPLPRDVEAKFASELLEQKPPSDAIRSIPLRMIL